MQYTFDFFPVTLVKTADLDPNRNYLLCKFPHGIYAAGAVGSFHSDSRGAKKLFPGLQPQIVTLYHMFRIPFFREFALCMGFVSSSEESLDHQLSTKPKPPFTGRLTVLIVGGAPEAAESCPGTNRILVNGRKGFVRLALKHGSPLVPAYSFRETDVYDQVRNPYFKRIQQYFLKTWRFPVLILKGRGFFQYSYGFLPHRVPITTVVGRPIEIPKISHPTKEQINEYHKQFVEKLTELFETHKHKYLPDADSKHLEFVQWTPLIPGFSFRETDIYDQVRYQYFLKTWRFPAVILKGRGFFQYSYGFLLHRVPITTVVGSPIEIPKISNPTKEQINEYHKQFVEELTELFETHKHKYLPDADSKHLEFI